MNAVEREYCRECRASLAASVLPAAPPAREERVRICPRCRRANPERAEACMDCGGRFVGGAAQLVAPRQAEPVVPGPEPRPCPGCGTEMETGTVFLDQGTFLDQFLWDRNGWMPLVFRRCEALRKETVLTPRAYLQAQRCPACNGVWIAPPPPRQSW